MYSMSTASNYFGVSSETLRRWVIEFTPYLSEKANVESGRKRRLSSKDMQVLALVAELKKQGKLFADIHIALSSGQRGELPIILDTPISFRDDPLLSLSNRIQELEKAITEEQIRISQVNFEWVKANAREEMLRELLREAYAEIARLNRLLGTRAI